MTTRSGRIRNSIVAAALVCLSAAVLHDALSPQDALARSGRASKSRGTKAAQINWVTSYPAAQKQAKSTGRLMMVDVYADWCGACHHLDDTTYKDRKVIELSRRFVSVKLNTEKEGGEAFSQKYKVEALPTILFLNSSGKEVKRLVGAYPAKEFVKVMTTLTKSR